MTNGLKQEFRHKSNSKRRKIYQNRTRTLIRNVGRRFFERYGKNLDNQEINAVANEVTIEILTSLKRTKDFLTRDLYPVFDNMDSLVLFIVDNIKDKIDDDVVSLLL